MKTKLEPWIVAAMLGTTIWAGTLAEAAILKIADRKFPAQQFCPLDFGGWDNGSGGQANLSFVAPSSSVRITFRTPNFFGGNHIDTHIDNLSVVLKDAFEANLHAPFPPPPDGYYYCNFPPNTDPAVTSTHAPSFMFTNFSAWPGAGGPLLQLFDSASEVDCWHGDVYFDATLGAPRQPATESDTSGGSLGIGTPDQQGTVSASRIVSGLVPGEEYLVFAWWYEEVLDDNLVATPLTIEIDSGSCVDDDGDGYVDCSGCTPCVLGPGQTCGECNDGDATIHPGAADAQCDFIDQNCSGQADEGFPSACQCARRAAGVVGWWPGDGDALDIVGGNHGTPTGPGATFTGIGFVDEAFYFSFGQPGGIALPDAAELEFSSQMTVEAWIRPDEISTSRPIVSKMSAFDGAYALQIEPAAFLEGTVTNGTSFDGLASPNGSIVQANWAHAAMTFDSGAWKLYLDGELTASRLSTVTSIWDLGSIQPHIGRTPSGSLEFVGYIDEVAMYDRALTAAEVRAIADAGTLGMCRCADADGDGYGTDGLSCPGGTAIDCAPSEPAHSPGTPELCNGLDENCNGVLDDGLSQATFYRDVDGDGYGSVTNTIQACAPPPGYMANALDCNDGNPTIHPGASELCNGIDDDCDGTLDDGLSQTTFYRDADNDGYGATAPTVQACAAPAGYVANDDDCNDANPSIRPGSSDPNCNNVDENCSGTADEGFVSPPPFWIATPFFDTLGGVVAGRDGMTMVGTGAQVIVWGGITAPSLQPTNTGMIYKPSYPPTDRWSPTSTGANVPAARTAHSAVWTGTKMIVWGGSTVGGLTSTGGIYDPATNSWTATANSNAPSGRGGHTAVWTGSKMIVWGGSGPSGGVYDPVANSWTVVQTSGAPAGWGEHTAVWSGTEMLVWGGLNSFGTRVANGGRYNPATNTWLPIPIASGLAGRNGHSAVWTGSLMIVWGGSSGTQYLGDGSRFNPTTGSWTGPIGGPTQRAAHSAVWDAAHGRMVVWGGYDGSTAMFSGATYEPVSSTWAALTFPNPPPARLKHAAVWLSASQDMVVWGGRSGSSYLNSGGRVVAVATTCGVGPCTRPSGYTCSSGQLGYGCTPGAPGTETCNGIDDDCDGPSDDGIPAPSGVPSISEARSGIDDASISWPAIPGSTGYDVVIGGLLALRSSSGDFTTSTTACAADDTSGLSAIETSSPAPGDGTWHLVRPVNDCGGNGSYDETTTSQQGSRDTEIDASPEACP